MSGPRSIVYAFGPYRLSPVQGLLLRGELPCPVGTRALALLVCLVERAGEVVTKEQLIDHVWPDTFVHEGNLRVHVGALRRILGDGQNGTRYLINVTGRGYSFAARVHVIEGAGPLPTPGQGTPRDNLPTLLNGLLGRDREVENIAFQVLRHRCVTLAGPGGIGKTTVATAAASRVLDVFDDGVWFINLASITDPELIPLTIAAVLGLSLPSGNAVEHLSGFLQGKQLLLIFDNCEHLVCAAARWIEAILQGAPRVNILATSRETLRVGGEWVHWLAPLPIPRNGDQLTVVEAMDYAAVGLFVECASMHMDSFVLQEPDVPLIVGICRRLDGLPLAIELAAARIDMFGLQGLARLLEDPFLLLAEGRRTALPHQRSLLHTLDWSYRLLSAVEQAVLRRLTVFRGEFTLDAAHVVAGGDGIDTNQVQEATLNLSAKSLIASGVSENGDQKHYLLHVTRSFARQKLDEPGEGRRSRARHAGYCYSLLAKAEADWDITDRRAWLSTYGSAIEDVRGALDWSFSPDGDPSLGVALTALAVPIGFQLSLIDEFYGRVERALLHVRRVHPPQPLAEMRLNVAFGSLSHNTRGPTPGGPPGLGRAIEISTTLGNLAYQVEPLLALSGAHLATGEYGSAVSLAKQANEIALRSENAMAVLATERTLAQVLHFDGDHVAAAVHARRVIDHPAPRLALAYNMMPVDRHIAMRIVLARTAWVGGCLREAAELVREATALATADSAFSLCPTLAFAAIPVALWNGDDREAQTLTAQLAEQAARYTLGFWQGWALAFQALLRERGGERSAAPNLSGINQLETFTTFSVKLLTPDVAMRAEAGAGGWCRPEILRAQGEWLLDQRAPGCEADAATLFQEAAVLARQQGAASWELRATLSFNRLRTGRSASNLARAALATVLTRFDGEPRTADLLAAERELAATGTGNVPPMGRYSSSSNRAARRRSMVANPSVKVS